MPSAFAARSRDLILTTPSLQNSKILDYFKHVTIAYGTVQWPHEQDFAPETLYLERGPISESAPTAEPISTTVGENLRQPRRVPVPWLASPSLRKIRLSCECEGAK